MNLFKFSLKYPFFILCFWALVLFFGTVSLMKTRITAFPSTEECVLSITTLYPGAGKDRVLDEVTKKLEGEVSKIKGLQTFISHTDNEMSEIKVYFQAGISERIAQAGVLLAISQAKNALPSSASEPVIQKINRYNKPLIRLAATSHLPPQDFYSLIKKSVQPVFEELHGVSRVNILGNSEPQAAVVLDMKRMQEREISASAVVAQLEKIGQNAYLGENTSFLIAGEFSSLSDLGSVVIHYLANDKAITLKDIAQIRYDDSYPAGYTYFNGDPCLLIDIFEREDIDTLKLEAQFDEALQKLRQKWDKIPSELTLTVLKDSGAYLKYTYFNFKKTLFISIAVAILLIWATFKDFRSIFVSCISVPTALAATLCVIYISGKTLNFITFGALIISIGLVVDDMIIIRENIFRHLKGAKNPFEGTLKAMQEICHPVIGTTSGIVVGCAAFACMQKMGILIYATEFALIIILTVGFSLLEAFTLGPVLCAYCLVPHAQRAPETLQKKVGHIYKKLLRSAMAHSWVLIAVSLCILASSFYLSTILHRRLLPSEIIGNIELQMQLNPDLSIQEAKKRAVFLSDQLIKKYPDIRQLGLLVEDHNQTTFNIEMIKESKRKLKPVELKRELEREAERLLNTKEIENYSVQEGTSDAPSYVPDLDLYLTSYERDTLVAYNDALLNKLNDFKGVFNVASSYDASKKETLFNFDFLKMKRLGVLTDPAAKELSLLLNGYKTPPIYPLEKGRSQKLAIEVQTRFPSMTAQQLLSKSFIPNINYMMVPLRSITSSTSSLTSHPILRKNGEDLIRITADFNHGERAHANPLEHTERVLKQELPLPKGITAEWTGKSKNLNLLFAELFKTDILSALLFCLALIVLYQNMTLPFVVLLSLPFSFAGSYLALYLTGYSLNIFSSIGTALAVAIAAKNGIIILCYINQLLNKGRPLLHAIAVACIVRLRPILMTSVAIVLATIPIVIIWDDFSLLEVSLGIALLGGVVSSTLLSLFIVPILFKLSYGFNLWFNRFALRYINTRPEEEEL